LGQAHDLKSLSTGVTDVVKCPDQAGWRSTGRLRQSIQTVDTWMDGRKGGSADKQNFSTLRDQGGKLVLGIFGNPALIQIADV
jgi:hypothetical protein